MTTAHNAGTTDEPEKVGFILDHSFRGEGDQCEFAWGDEVCGFFRQEHYGRNPISVICFDKPILKK